MAAVSVEELALPGYGHSGFDLGLGLTRPSASFLSPPLLTACLAAGLHYSIYRDLAWIISWDMVLPTPIYSKRARELVRWLSR